MPRHQQITSAREKAKRIREYAVSFRQERRLEKLLDGIAVVEFEEWVRRDILRVYAPSAFRSRRAA